MKKLLFFIPTLTGGGAEKVLLTLVNNLNYTKFDVTVMTLLNKGVYVDKLNSNVKYKSVISTKNKILQKLLGYLIQFKIPASIVYKLFIKEQYDYEIAYLEGFPTKLIGASNSKSSKKFAWVHCDPSLNTASENVYKNFQECVDCYKKFDRVYFVSESSKNAFIKRYDIRDNLFIQFNVVEDDVVKQQSQVVQNDIIDRTVTNILTVGRLSSEKGMMRLVEVAKRLLDEKYSVKLYLVGEGNEREKISSFIEANNLGESVFLLGFKENPYPYINDCDLFVCSSYSEGFSTVVTEAVILKKPVVTTECAGMREILGANCEYGLIVENDDDALYCGIKQMLDGELDKYRQAVVERSDFFTKDKRINEYEMIFS